MKSVIQTTTLSILLLKHTKLEAAESVRSQTKPKHHQQPRQQLQQIHLPRLPPRLPPTHTTWSLKSLTRTQLDPDSEWTLTEVDSNTTLAIDRHTIDMENMKHYEETTDGSSVDMTSMMPNGNKSKMPKSVQKEQTINIVLTGRRTPWRNIVNKWLEKKQKHIDDHDVDHSLGLLNYWYWHSM